MYTKGSEINDKFRIKYINIIKEEIRANYILIKIVLESIFIYIYTDEYLK